MDKAALKERLESITPFGDVFPTARSHARQRSALAGVVHAVEAGDVAQMDELSFVEARNVLSSEVRIASSALPQLLELPGAEEQLAGFTRAGFNFFHADPSYANEPLEIRRARGGNGAVTRVVANGTRIALETRRLIVAFTDDVDDDAVQQVFRTTHLVPIRRFQLGGPTWHVISDGGLATDVCLQLLEVDTVRYAEPDFIEHVNQRTAAPPDPLIKQQWHHQVLGLPGVWSKCTGAGVRIAIVDNGFMVAHPDLDPDPDSSGWFRSSPDGDDSLLIPGLAQMPDGDHGTACAGMATARSNNSGGVGVAFGATLHVVACLEDQVGTQATLARALAYAADPRTEGAQAPGADVIACSLGPNTATWRMSNVLSDAIDFVTLQGRKGSGAPLFWASTNGNYPIAADEVCSHPRVVSVGRSTATDTDDGSGFGPELAFLAPGVEVLIPSSDGSYQVTTGTSFACPCAAGIAALVLEREPGMTATQIRDHLRASCRQVGDVPYIDGRNDTYGFGRLDAVLALGFA